jgi:hypothetical protein
MEEVEVKLFRRIAEKIIHYKGYSRVLPLIEVGPYPIGNIVKNIKSFQYLLEKLATADLLEKLATEIYADHRSPASVAWNLASLGIRGGILALGDKMTPEEMVDKMTNLYQRKNSDYGNAFEKSMDKFGVIVSAIRIGDKVNRLDSLCEKYRPKDEDAVPHPLPLVEDESMGDTFIDLACYAIMTIMWLNQKLKTEV